MPRTTNLALAAAGTAAVLLAAACGVDTPSAAVQSPEAVPPAVSVRDAGRTPDPVDTSASAPGSAVVVPPTTVSASPTTPSVPDPGVLPQTDVMPGDQDPQFIAGTQALWRAIVQDNPALAKPFFFPRSAYLQVKDIADPAQDYQNRLMAWYDLDIKAAHQQLGAGAATAKLVSVAVPKAQAEWIQPGVEYNKGSYYRVYGTRLTYEENGHTASFGIFSLISWRGEWYVVHLGPSTRPAMQGIVYEPQN
ncbi:hypothetical protein [Actinospica robiniae]|uniref:hypothetical protein n=1 Tax=Actinospica robiniae TaxID=304901 RepID=UPI00040A6B96|nr:hypothetical protein [Actinospica robiniae]